MILQASRSKLSKKILYAWKEFRSGSVLSPWAWLCLITLWVSQPSPDGPGKHQDGYRWPLAPGPPQGTAPTVIPEVRPGLPAGFPTVTLNPQLTGPQHPQHPRSAPAAPGVGATGVTFWKCSSLKPWVFSPQHTGWHSLPFPRRSHTSLGHCHPHTVATRRHTPSA